MLQIEGYDDLSEVGRGGFGVVYRARDARFGREVAVKVLFGALRDDAARSRFERECRAAGSVSSHPNIVTVHGAGALEDGRPYLVMEYLPEGSLADRLALAGPVVARDVASMGVKLAAALETAHAAGIVHRDVKPENVLFTGYGEPCLGDFGVARIAGSTETRSGVITASLHHAAPEILAGERPTVTADVYSLASTLVTAVLGRAPFEGHEEEPLAALVARIATQPPPDLEAARVPRPLADALTAGMAKDPADRPQTAAAFASSLRAAQGASGLEVTPAPLPDASEAPTLLVGERQEGHGQEGLTRQREIEPTPVAEPEPAPRRRRGLVLAFAAVLVVALAVPVAATLAGRTPEPTTDGGVAQGTDGEDTEGTTSTDGGKEDTGTDRGGDEETDDVSDGHGDPATDGSGDTTTDGGDATSGGDGTDGGNTSSSSTGPTSSGSGEPENRSPVAAFSPSTTSGKAPLQVRFDASGSSDPDGSITSYTWKFGDGATGSGSSVTHTYATAGTFTVELTVTDASGASDKKAIPIQVVANQVPVARFQASATSGKAPVAISFDASSSGDPDGTIAKYHWDFGDGTVGSGRSASHTYEKAGTFSVKLTVTDDDGATASTTQTVTIAPANEPPVLPAKSFTFHVPVGQPTVLVSDNRLTSGWHDPDGTAGWLCVQWLPRTKDFWLDKADCDGSKLEFTAERAGTYIIDYRIGESQAGGPDPGPPWSVQVNTITVIVE